MARKADFLKKKNIILAAVQEFSQKGYAGTRIIDVARAAGIGKGTIYEYFKSKEDLFFAVFQEVMQESEISMAAAAIESESISKRLMIMNDTLIGTWLDKLELYSLVMEFWSAATAATSRDQFKSTFQAGYQAFRQTLAALIQQGIDTGEFSPDCRPAEVASGLIGMWDALLLQAWLDNTFDAFAASRECVAVMLRGLARPENKES